MTVDFMDVLDREGQFFPLFPLDRTRDALAAYCASRWPVGRRKSVREEWGLSADEARSIIRGAASQLTIDKVFLHPNGRWRIVFPIYGALFRQSAAEFVAAQRSQHVQTAARLRAVGRDLRALGPLGGDRGSGLGDERRRRGADERGRVSDRPD